MTQINHPEVAYSVLTCEACPEQYEGRLRDGRYFYFRMRFSHARLAVGATAEEVLGQEHVSVFAGNYEGDDLKGCFDSNDERDVVFAELMRLHKERET